MWIENKTHLEDLKSIVADSSIPWEELSNKRILVTGATGLIGSNIVNALLYQAMHSLNECSVVALVRDEEKARKMFSQQLEDNLERLSFVVGDVTSLPKISGPIDYIIHGACPTTSSMFLQQPVETIDTIISGTKNILELARQKQTSSVVFLSSMEAYGSPTEETPLTEDAPGYFDSMAIRSCYPESKRMCEALCCAYAQEYNVPAKVVRLAQTFGPGVDRNDKRVFADFATRALSNEDIVLLTKGDSRRMYLYTMDAVSAILTVLLKGTDGICYNAANKETYCSIKEMAELVSYLLSDGSQVVFQLDGESHKKFPPSHKLYLDTHKLEALGWCPTRTLSEMFIRMVKGF